MKSYRYRGDAKIVLSKVRTIAEEAAGVAKRLFFSKNLINCLLYLGNAVFFALLNRDIMHSKVKGRHYLLQADPIFSSKEIGAA